jgi:hypothetical protein
MVPTAGIEPATSGLGILLTGIHKCLKIPDKALTTKQLQPLLIYILLYMFRYFWIYSVTI